MNREERRRQEREARRAGRGQGVPGYPGWTPPQNRLQSAAFFPGTEAERHRQGQDFMAGTVFAAGGGVMFAGAAIDPDDDPGADTLPTPFAIYVHEDERTFGPAPQLRQLFKLLDERGGQAVYDEVLSNTATAWALLDHPDEPLVKFKIDFRQTGVLTGTAELLLMARNYADHWKWIARGGMVTLTSPERINAAVNRPGATMADGLESSLMVGVGGSPALQSMIRNHRWPE